MSLATFEQQFEDGLRALDADSRDCTRSLYTELVIHHVAGGDFEILDRLNVHPAFWNDTLRSLQTTTFVALGRLFDDDRDTHNIDRLLSFADDTPGIFSRAALRERKIRSGLAANLADEYIKDAFELRRGGLRQLREVARSHRELYDAKIKNIRQRVFAHRGRITKNDVERLFLSLPVRTLESVSVFTLRLSRTLFHMYQNGRAPELDDVVSNIGEVMKSFPARGQSSWEHLHAAKETYEFLQWLKTGSPLRDPLEDDIEADVDKLAP